MIASQSSIEEITESARKHWPKAQAVPHDCGGFYLAVTPDAPMIFFPDIRERGLGDAAYGAGIDLPESLEIEEMRKGQHELCMAALKHLHP